MSLRGRTLTEKWQDLKGLLCQDKADKLDVEDFEIALAEADHGIGQEAEEVVTDLAEAEAELKDATGRLDRLQRLLR